MAVNRNGEDWVDQDFGEKMGSSVWGESEIALDIQVELLGGQLLLWVWSSKVLNVKPQPSAQSQVDAQLVAGPFLLHSTGFRFGS